MALPGGSVQFRREVRASESRLQVETRVVGCVLKSSRTIWKLFPRYCVNKQYFRKYMISKHIPLIRYS